MSLQTPEKLRSLQKKVYLKAKAGPRYRFYLLYDKVWREDILAHAYKLARANRGAPGVDGITFAKIESAGRKEWLSGLGKMLRDRTYRSDPVRRVMWEADDGRQAQPAGHPARRGDLAAACQPVHEPLPEALAADRAGAQAQGAGDLLCGRLRDSEPRLCGRGEGVGGGGHDPSGLDPQRGEDVASQCVRGTLRLPRLQLRSSLLPKEWPTVSRRQPVEEERGPSQAADQRHPAPGQHCALERGARGLEPCAERLVGATSAMAPARQPIARSTTTS